MSRVVLGMPAFNGSAHLAEALESLLQQTHRDFGLVICDDWSIDATPEVARSYAESDPRIAVVVNERRIGMVRNWVKVFDEARRLHPDMELFAWVSDHDTWHRRWLASLVEAIDADPAAVLAYPHSVGMTTEGAIVSRPRSFSTAGMADPFRRVTATWEDGAAGYMVYGLMRADALEASGVYRLVRDPDRLLMLELAMRGTFVQVPEILYFRRRGTEKPTQERQRAAFYPEGVPLRAFLPWQLRHAWQILLHYVVRPSAPVPRALGARVGRFVLAAGVERELHRYVFRNRDRSVFDRLALRVTSRRKRELSLTLTEPSRRETKSLWRGLQGRSRVHR